MKYVTCFLSTIQVRDDTHELLKNEELDPSIQQPNKKNKKKKYLGKINYRVCTICTVIPPGGGNKAT